MSRVSVRVKVNMAMSPDQWTKQCVANANTNLDTAIGDYVMPEAKANCPVGTPESTGIPHYVGGTLRDGHQVKAEQDAYVFTRYFYNDVEYSRYVHDGTYKMAARPWFLNAVLHTQSEVMHVMSRM